jgi:3-oxoacyl-[acyl-carrier-protein] synthase III
VQHSATHSELRAPEREAALASIVSVAYHLGELKPIAELDFLRDDPKRLSLYQMAGFDRYAESDLSMRALAYGSAIEAIEQGGIPKEKIGVCLYVAESFDRDEAVSSLEVNRLLMELGLVNTVPIHVSISNCANIVGALRIASAMIRARETEHVLIISVDKAPRRYAGRKMFQEVSIKSDVSLSCLVSRPGTGPYDVLYLGQHNSADLADIEIVDPSSYAMPKFKNIRRAAKHAIDSLTLAPAAYAHIITNNYSREVTKMFIELCGFRKEAGCFENIGRFAHAVAGDILINLKDLEEKGAVRRDDLLFLMADSITNASVLCLRRR